MPDASLSQDERDDTGEVGVSLREPTEFEAEVGGYAGCISRLGLKVAWGSAGGGEDRQPSASNKTASSHRIARIQRSMKLSRKPSTTFSEISQPM